MVRWWIGLVVRASSLRTSASAIAWGKRFCFDRWIFFCEQEPITIEGLPIEILDAVMVGLEGAEGGSALTQVQDSL
jgi:hypothetical protein